jgi:uncharacterized membrane protein (DUF2068 family)
VTVATILVVLLCLFDFPFPWESLFPGVEQPPAFIVYSGIVLGIVGLVVAVGLWLLKRWSFWATLVAAALNFLRALPGVFAAPTAALRVASAVNAIVAVLLFGLVVRPAFRCALTAS